MNSCVASEVPQRLYIAQGLPDTGDRLVTSVDASESTRREGIARGPVLTSSVFAAAVHLPRAGRGICRPGPNHTHPLEAQYEKLAFRPRPSSTVRHAFLLTLLRFHPSDSRAF